MKYKPTILIDLDGVLNTYDGNYQEGYIPPIKEGAKDFLEKIYESYTLILFTTRNKNIAQIWLRENNIEKYFKRTTNKKLPAYLIIDDRCVCFNGDYIELLSNIEHFMPSYKN